MRSFKKLLASLIARATKRMGIATRITISITKPLSFPL